MWDPAGNRLYYRQDQSIMEVSVEPGDVPRLGRATALFELDRFDQGRGYFPAGDDRFIVVAPAGNENEDAARSGINVVRVGAASSSRERVVLPKVPSHEACSDSKG